MAPTHRALSSLGVAMAPPGISDTVAARPGGRDWTVGCLRRHATGDWGDLDTHDHDVNRVAASDGAIASGHRVLSARAVQTALQGPDQPGDQIWVITSTEALTIDLGIRATNVLWPSEY